MNEDKDKNKTTTKVLGDRTRLPETPDLSGLGTKPGKSTPFALDDFRSGAPENVTKP